MRLLRHALARNRMRDRDTRKLLRWRTRRGGISFFSCFPQGYHPPIIHSSFVFRPTFYSASCISCPPASFSHVSTHKYAYIAYAQRYSLFRSGRNVQTRRTRPTRDTSCSFLPSFHPSFLAFVYVLKSR